jgi:3-mercaptopyruvate sulfurtransferase SseA
LLRKNGVKNTSGDPGEGKKGARMKRLSYKGKWVIPFIAALLIAVPLFIQSCGSGGYSNPQSEIKGSSVLISPETLNGWIANGYGTDSFGFTKIVILDVAGATGTTSYTGSGHVQNAFLLDTAADLTTTRSDGVSDTITMVANRTMMDSLIQRTGIDENTVVVITGDSLLNMGAAYFNFRYWGFPKNRLRVLDRTNVAYKTAGFTLVNTVPPAPTPSAYNVCKLTQNTSLRAPLSEMITLAQGGIPNSVIWDVRAPNEYNGVAGSTTGPSGSATTGYVAFEGHVKGAVNLIHTTHLSADGSTLLSPDFIKSTLTNVGITPDKTAYTY